MIKSTIKGIHHTSYNHVNNIHQHLFHMFQTSIKLKEYNIKIQYYILKYTHNYNYHIITYSVKLCIQTSSNSITISHTHITITIMHTLNYHITLMWLNARHVTLCMRYLNVNPTFHRFPIQYLESKPRFRSGQDQSHYVYFQLRINVCYAYFHSRINV
jgi:hypothetical protein